MQFSDIFQEYYSQFRGQVPATWPTFADREFKLGIFLGNNSIRKWDRADGQLWRELITTAQEDDSGDLVVSSGLLDYDAPTNMRKPPAKIRFISSSNASDYFEIPVSEPQDALNAAPNSSLVWFEGSANKGYTMWLSSDLATTYTGRLIDYTYVKTPNYLSTTSDPSSTVIDMSDPNFMIQDMLASRFTQARNGFGVNVASRNATLALANMKLENNSGMYGNSESLRVDRGWGVPNNTVNDMKL